MSVAPLLTPFGAWDGHLAETADHHGEKERSRLSLVVWMGFLGDDSPSPLNSVVVECCCPLER